MVCVGAGGGDGPGVEVWGCGTRDASAGGAGGEGVPAVVDGDDGGVAKFLRDG